MQEILRQAQNDSLEKSLIFVPPVSTRTHDYYVYIVTNNTLSTLHVGVTNDLLVRVWQHRAGERPGTFSQRYHCAHLVYFEHYREIRDAISREKPLKGWRRAKKNTLIATLNPQWEDLAANWFHNFLNQIPVILSEAAAKLKEL